MSDYKLVATARKATGKNKSRQMRAQKQVPAVLYGGVSGKEMAPTNMGIDSHSLQMVMQQGAFYTHIHTLELDGKTEKVLARDIQRDPIKGHVIHADFLRFDGARVLKVNVRVNLTDEDQSPGLEKGGVLQLLRSDVELLCRADSIPEFVSISMAGKDIGDAAKISEVTMPKGVKPSVDRDFTIASIVGTRTSTMSDLGEEGAAEGETAEGDAAAEKAE